ncbi:DUF3862 domain-containing protein [Lactiplantibacillus garii]|nr:DUF3862 domain-containing protein [Lactiplantibacillus garii]
MFRNIIVALSGLLLLTLTACSHPTATSSATHHDDRRATSRPSTTKLIPGVTRANFDRIQLAIKPDDYASTIEQVRALLGKPNHTTYTHLNAYDRPVKTYVWENPDKSLAGAVVSVSFHDNSVVAKNYRDAKLDPNTKITTAALDQLPTGAAYDQVTAKLGTPNVVSNRGTATENVQTVTYDHIQGQPAANVTLTFQHNQLTTKSRTAI